MNCPGSVRMSEGIPDDDNEYKAEGRAAHELAERILRGTDTRADYHSDMMEAVSVFTDAVLACHKAQPLSKLIVENQFTLADLTPPEPMFGTADAVVFGSNLDVFDLKYGQGVVVEVRDNPQLMYYVLGALLHCAPDLEIALSLFDQITATIVQPRAIHPDGPVRTAVLTKDELRRFAGELMRAAIMTQQIGAPLVPGSWCRFCPASGHCPALQQHAQLVAQVDFDAVPIEAPPSPEHIPLEVAADFLSRVPILEAWIDALRARVTRELEAGAELPGWKMVPKRPMRHWKDEEEVKKWAEGAGLTVEEMHAPLELLSPAQMEKVVRKVNLPAELYEKVSSGLTLVPASDPRPAAAIGPQSEFTALPPVKEAA